MCDACSAKGRNWSLANGQGKSRLENARFYKAFGGRRVSIKLCYLCSISLFTSGEFNFLKVNPVLRNQIAGRSSSGDDIEF